MFCLGLVLFIHAGSGWHSALLPLYMLPVWVATYLDGIRPGALMVGLSAASSTFYHWKIGSATTLAELVFTLLLSTLTFGVTLVIMGWMQNLVQQNQQLAQRDPLTGLLNRRALKELAPRALGKAQRQKESLIVVAIDCDGFKKLNDTHGHSAGDHVLRILAGVLDKQTRDSDMVARTGGDEFLLVLRGASTREAQNILARVEREFEYAVRVAGFECSVSMGMAVMEEEHQTFEQLLHTADKAMYEGKEGKRKSRAYLN
ncbi:MAG TPA: GGDEF domain-containing protein [Fimbriimonas sp.]|nr:GGDEF domain-containing protein [Fimbriimonas sp.]